LLKYTKNFQVFALILLTSALLLAAINPNIASVKAQTQATVTVLTSIGGTTAPSGNTTYNDGTAVTLTATAGEGFVFQYWEIASSAGSYIDYDNPATLNVSGGVTYAVQAVFQPAQVPPAGVNVTNYATAAIVVVLAAVGGTTSPVSGTYALENATQLNLTATPSSGWKFDHWVIGGSPLTHGAYSFTDTPTDNPYNVNHGYGNTYTYQPVFSPTSTSPTPTPTIPEFSTQATIIIAVLLVSVSIIFGAYTYRKRK